MSVLASNAVVVALLLVPLWVVSVRMRNASIVDPWWSILFLVVAVNSARLTGLTPGKGLLVAVVALWAIRLWAYLLRRDWGKPEDPRYAAFRAHYGPERYWWVSLFQVFALQGVLALAVSTPLAVGGAAAPPDPISASDWIGLAVFAVGFGFEVIGDEQLRRFRADPASRGRVLDSGLFRFTRHPNYFGEAVLQWGFWVLVLDVPWGWATAFGPALMTFLLVRVSGVSMLDKHLIDSRPGYEQYMARTSAFVPRPPRG
jgi:steroid 5-alpha reductase family enzyme